MKMAVPNSSVLSALWILPGLLTGILLLLNPDLDDQNVTQMQGNTMAAARAHGFGAIMAQKGHHLRIVVVW